MKISIIIPAHNPDPGRLHETLEGLRRQTLPADMWELLIIDNASSDTAVFAQCDLTWTRNARVIREEKLGLTAARLRGFRESRSEYIVMVDDDNVLSPDYLQNVLHIATTYPELGAFGGKSLPKFEVKPEPWVHNFFRILALRDLGEQPLLAGISNGDTIEYPACAPIGAGMAIRAQAASAYADALQSRKSVVMDRTGKSLTSGGDNDLVLTVLRSGWKVGYFPELKLRHLIPPGRCTKQYLARLTRSSSESWIQVLDVHGIRTWPKLPRWLLMPLQMRLYFRVKAWRAPENYVEWQNRCGILQGRAKLN